VGVLSQMSAVVTQVVYQNPERTRYEVCHQVRDLIYLQYLHNINQPEILTCIFSVRWFDMKEIAEDRS